MSSTGAARRSGGGVGHFAVGRRLRRHVAQVAPPAVVDAAGCGCRPRRARLTMPALSLPSFLKPGSSKPAAARSAAASASSTTTTSFFFPSSSSAASFSSSASSSGAASKKHHHHQQQQGNNWAPAPSSPAPATKRKKKKKTRQQQQGQRSSYYYQVEEKKKKEAMAMDGTEEEEVGVAVEKESSDPRGDFRESMTQMVVETGLCGWDDLRCMLRRLLALNAPRHHAAILTAFAELCAQLAAPPPPHHYQYQY